MAGKGRAQGGKSGGPRPGSGRKRKETVEEQITRRTIVFDVFNPEEWRATVTSWKQTAIATGNYALLFPLLPYIMGAAKMEIEHTGRVEHVQMDAARKVLRVIGGTDDERRAG